MRHLRLAWLTAVMMSVASPAWAEAVTLEVSHALQGFPALVDGLKVEFERAHPDIRLRMIAGRDEWDALLQDTLRTATAGDLPDVSHQSLNHLQILVRRELVQQLDPFLGKDQNWQRLGHLPSLLTAATHEGKVYALPFATTVPVLYFNMALARQAGFAGDTLPSAWPEVIELARRIDALGPDIAGIYAEYDATSAWIFQSLLMSQGGRMMSPDEREIAFAGKEGLWALEVTREMGGASLDMTRGQARQAFAAGKTGIHIRSASGIPPIEKAAAGNFEVRVGRFPMPTPEGRLPGASNGVVMFTADPARQPAAWKYIAFVTGPAGQMLVARHTGYAPTNTVAIESPEYLRDYYAENPNHRVVIEQFPIMVDWYSFPTDNSVRIFETMIEQQWAVARQQATPEAALAAMAEAAVRLLPR